MPIYLDHAATTPVDPRVLEQMLPLFTEHFGNAASSSHRRGLRAARAIDIARDRVAAAVGARSPREIVFTSGATESNNLALKGIAGPGDHVISCQTEHKSVLGPLERLAREGVQVSLLAPGADGRLSPGEIAEALRPNTRLVSLMGVNNETGAMHPIAEIAPVVHAAGALLHCDATQMLGKVGLHVRELGVDLASFSGHKLGGPMGVGGLYVRRGVALRSLIEGGRQERGLRSGTANLPGIVGLGAACELAHRELDRSRAHLADLRAHLSRELRALGATVFGAAPEHSSPAILCASLGIEAPTVLAALPEVELSAGSACTSASGLPSHVLRAMGVPPSRARTAVRFSTSRSTTRTEIDQVVRQIAALVHP